MVSIRFHYGGLVPKFRASHKVKAYVSEIGAMDSNGSVETRKGGPDGSCHKDSEKRVRLCSRREGLKMKSGCKDKEKGRE